MYGMGRQKENPKCNKRQYLDQAGDGTGPWEKQKHEGSDKAT